MLVHLQSIATAILCIEFDNIVVSFTYRQENSVPFHTKDGDDIYKLHTC